MGIELAYAISIHKSQGSEYGVTIICCVSKSEFMERSLIYTALSRSKSLCLVVGKQSLFDKAVRSTPRVETIEHGFMNGISR
ncbi:ATP-binding domain-containing protein [Photobacterium damselae subsp. damselae]